MFPDPATHKEPAAMIHPAETLFFAPANRAEAELYAQLSPAFIPAEEADELAGMPPGWARTRAAMGGLGGRMIDGRAFVRRSSVLRFLDSRRKSQGPAARRPAPAHLRLVVDNSDPAARAAS
jgi:hypothetical protein